MHDSVSIAKVLELFRKKLTVIVRYNCVVLQSPSIAKICCNASIVSFDVVSKVDTVSTFKLNRRTVIRKHLGRA